MDPLSNKKQRGYEDNTKRLADLESLVKRNISVPVVTTSLDYVEGRLPANLLFHIKSRADITYDCNTDLQATTATAAITKNYFKLVFSQSPPYTNLTIQINILAGGTFTLFDPTNYTALISQLGDVNEKFYLIEVLRNAMPAGWTLYWEDYRGLYQKDTMFLEAPDGTYVPDTAELLIAAASVDTNTNNTINIGTQYTLAAGTLTDIRIVDSEKDFTKDPNERTRADAPVGTLSESKIQVYDGESFILPQVYVTYIRRPKPISLYLGWHCELHERTHGEIITMTAFHMKIISENPSAQLTAADFIE